MPSSKETVKEQKHQYYLRNRDSILSKQKGQRKKKKPTKEQTREYNRRRSYKLEPEEYAAMLNSQNNRCKICLLESDQSLFGLLHVDHDHTTKEVRGLLCHRCNRGLGGFRDDPKLIRATLSYLGA